MPALRRLRGGSRAREGRRRDLSPFVQAGVAEDDPVAALSLVRSRVHRELPQRGRRPDPVLVGVASSGARHAAIGAPAQPVGSHGPKGHPVPDRGARRRGPAPEERGAAAALGGHRLRQRRVADDRRRVRVLVARRGRPSGGGEALAGARLRGDLHGLRGPHARRAARRAVDGGRAGAHAPAARRARQGALDARSRRALLHLVPEQRDLDLALVGAGEHEPLLGGDRALPQLLAHQAGRAPRGARSASRRLLRQRALLLVHGGHRPQGGGGAAGVRRARPARLRLGRPPDRALGPRRGARLARRAQPPFPIARTHHPRLSRTRFDSLSGSALAARSCSLQALPRSKRPV